ncbi:hypothetical protein [Segatella copri]|jgi:hypothetical protein|nr:hypothetical protein [Segatella copri]
MNDITAIFAFLKYCLGYKENMSRVIAGMDWQSCIPLLLSKLCWGFALRV